MTTGDKAELLPCPFCGKPAETGANPPYRIVGGKQQRAPVQKVWCGNEDCPLGSQDFECGVTEWNVRPYPPASAEVVERVALIKMLLDTQEQLANAPADSGEYLRLVDSAEHLLGKAADALASGVTVQVPEGWKLVRWDYTSLFNAIGAATKAQQGGAVEVSVKAFKEAMLAADLTSQLAAAPQKQEPK